MLKDEIISYIQLLNKNFGLQISLHGPKIMVGEFLSYGIHTNPYCMLIKQNKRLWHKCRCQQSRILAGNIPACGTCFAGVFEYIVPLQTNGSKKPQAFICISGYRDDKRAARQRALLSRSYGMDKRALERAYQKHLKPMPDAPPDASLLAPLVAMLERYFAKVSPARSGSGDYIYAHAIAYIHQHYKEKIRLEDICDFCHCSKSYISHMFKKQSGTSVSNYIAQLRLEKAKKLLQSGRFTVKAAAEAVGYSEPYYFSNSFKKYYNISPSSIIGGKDE